MKFSICLIFSFYCCSLFIAAPDEVYSIPTTSSIHLDADKIARMKFLVTLPSNETVQINLAFKLLQPSQPLPLYTESTVFTAKLLNNNKTRQQQQEQNDSTSASHINVVAANLDANLTATALLAESLTASTPKTTEAPGSATEETAAATPAIIITTTTTTDSETETTAKTTPLPPITSTDASAESSTSKTSTYADPLNLLTVEEAIESFRKNLIEKELEIAGIIESKYPFYRHFRLEYGEGVVLPVRCTYESNYKEQTLKISCYEYREMGNQRILSNGEFEKTESLSFVYTPEYIDARNVKQTYSMSIS